MLLLILLCWCQVERHRRAAEAARAALAANEQQLKELRKEAAKADKDRCAGSALVWAAASVYGWDINVPTDLAWACAAATGVGRPCSIHT
jgi:hypothetical protein